MIFRYFTHAFVDQFAQHSVDQFEAAVPNREFTLELGKQSAKRVEKIELALRHLLTSIQRFDTEQKLNVFQHARLAQQLQNHMIDHGYPPQFARDIAAKVSRMRVRH